MIPDRYVLRIPGRVGVSGRIRCEIAPLQLILTVEAVESSKYVRSEFNSQVYPIYIVFLFSMSRIAPKLLLSQSLPSSVDEII